MTREDQSPEQTIIADDGRVLLMSCQRFVDTICRGHNCFICGADPAEVPFNDEHIVPRWVLRRFDLFEKEITLPTGERRKYGGYRIPCCEACNKLLGEQVETPVSLLLKGTFSEVQAGLAEPRNRERLFIWLSLLFLKTHLKDARVPVHKDRRLGHAVIGDQYEWSLLHHIHAVARSPYTGANLMPDVVGSLQVFEIAGSAAEERYDYVGFSNQQTLVVQIGAVGIVAVLTDCEAAQIAWSEKLAVVDRPISNLQLREVGAMLACANANLKVRPEFGTFFADRSWLFIFARKPPTFEMEPFDPEEFGHTLLFAVGTYVESAALEIDGTSDPDLVASKIATGYVRFLTDENGKLRPALPRAGDAQQTTSDK